MAGTKTLALAFNFDHGIPGTNSGLATARRSLNTNEQGSRVVVREKGPLVVTGEKCTLGTKAATDGSREPILMACSNWRMTRMSQRFIKFQRSLMLAEKRMSETLMESLDRWMKEKTSQELYTASMRCCLEALITFTRRVDASGWRVDMETGQTVFQAILGGTTLLLT